MNSLSFTREDLRKTLRSMESEFNRRNQVSDFIGWDPSQRELYFAVCELVKHHIDDGEIYTLKWESSLETRDLGVLAGWIQSVQLPTRQT